MTNQEFKTLEEYNSNDRATLTYVLICPYNDVPIKDFIDSVLEHMPIDVVEWRIAIQDEFYYIILKFKFGVIVPFIKFALVKSFGEERTQQFQYCKISSVKKASKMIEENSKSITSDTYLTTEKRKCSSKELFDWAREKSLHLKRVAKDWKRNKDMFENTHNISWNDGETLESYLIRSEEKYIKECPRP